VTNIRVLRHSHGLTLVDLAMLTDIPARTLAEIEYGFQRLDYESRARLARFFEIAPELLSAGSRERYVPRPAQSPWLSYAAPAVAATLAGAALLTSPLLDGLAVPAPAPPSLSATAAPTTTIPTRMPRPVLAAIAAPSFQTAPPSITATALPAATPQPAPSFILSDAGRLGCPVEPAAGRVVLTQGYGIGSHAPAAIWGAVDLAIDADGDGYAEPESTWGAPVVSALRGVAHVYMGSWPGGNFVRVIDEQSGWSVAYGHLDMVAVADGQPVEVGVPIGTVGSTGMASGPHLHYEVWHGEANIDPTGLVRCG
jgi:murein DD-endopeptidase MepM/ murein hydrolase activator NlpD